MRYHTRWANEAHLLVCVDRFNLWQMTGGGDLVWWRSAAGHASDLRAVKSVRLIIHRDQPNTALLIEKLEVFECHLILAFAVFCTQKRRERSSITATR